MKTFRKVESLKIGAAGAALLAAALWSPSASAQVVYGYAGQEQFNNGLSQQPEIWDSVAAFDAQMVQFATPLYAYNLTGSVGPRLLEEGFDTTNKIESSDIIYISTHMGSWDWNGAVVYGPDNVHAFSKNMVLGNTGKGLSVLALGGCTTTAWHKRPFGDEKGVTSPIYGVLEDFDVRWSKAFRAGLRIIVGNWDAYYAHKDHGKWFGYYLRTGSTIETAWEKADWKVDPRIDTATAASGTSSSNCYSRLTNLKITNLSSYPRLRNNSVVSYCQHWWTNDSLGDR